MHDYTFMCAIPGPCCFLMISAIKLSVQVTIGRKHPAHLSTGAWDSVSAPSPLHMIYLDNELDSSGCIILVTPNDLNNIGLIWKVHKTRYGVPKSSGFRLMFRQELLVVG